MDKIVKRYSAFNEIGFKETIKDHIIEIQKLYKSDQTPWIIGYSGGKDSTAVLQLVWLAISELPLLERTKTIHVISTDTLVENPIVSKWVIKSHNRLKQSASELEMPFEIHLLTPSVEDTFLVNLVGKGYPAPRNNFRWCTDRLKIKPSNKFTRDLVQKHGEAIMLLGVRKAESAARAQLMEKYEKLQVRDNLNPSNTMANCLIYPPISKWSDDDVWLFLLQYKNPWGHTNKDLLSMYSGATADGECPLVVDTSTPSCGNSRFGCWVCTLVDEDKSMTAMIKNDYEKAWMGPMLEFRNEIDFHGDERNELERSRRDFRRMSGAIHLHNDKLVHGPYTQESRAYFLKKLLTIQKDVQQLAPEEMKDHEIITLDELKEIRRIWTTEKHEIEDLLPKIYKEVFDIDFPDIDRENQFDFNDIELLKELSVNQNDYDLIKNLIGIESDYKNMIRRTGLFSQLEKTLEKFSYTSEEDALQIAIKRNKGNNYFQNLDDKINKKMEEINDN